MPALDPWFHGSMKEEEEVEGREEEEKKSHVIKIDGRRQTVQISFVRDFPKE